MFFEKREGEKTYVGSDQFKRVSSGLLWFIQLTNDQPRLSSFRKICLFSQRLFL